MTSLEKVSKIRRLNAGVVETSTGITDPDYTVFVGVLTVSDRCARGETGDLSGPNLQKIIQEQTRFRSVIKVYKIIPDESDEIVETLVHWSDNLGLQLIITTGGTGLGPRDVTPEATAAVIEKETHGFTIAIITASLKVTNDAMVTRLKTGIRGKTIIINLPGSKKASAECLEVVLPAIPHALECMQNDVARVCACSVSDNYTNIGSKRRIIDDVATEVQRFKQNLERPAQQSSPAAHHQIVTTPVMNITEDELARADVDIESILSNNAAINATATTSSSDASIIQGRNSEDFQPISVDEAFEIVKKAACTLDSEEVTLLDAFGRILAEDIKITQNNAPMASVSGYALIGAAKNGEIRSLGAVGQTLKEGGQARQVASGSILPKGTNTVVAIKETRLLGGNKIHILNDVQSGQGVQFDASGNFTINKGTKLGPFEVGQLSALSISSCRAFKFPVVGVLSVGEKDIEAANQLALQLYLRQHSITSTDLGSVPQDIRQLSDSLNKAIGKADIIIVTSKSEVCREVAKSLIEKLFDAAVQFGTVLMEPWAPSYFLTVNEKKKMFFVLPEYPLAGILCTLFLIPGIRKMGGAMEIKDTTIKAKLPSDQNLKDKPFYTQCKVRWRQQEPIPWIECIGTEGNQQSACDTNAILVLPSRGSQCSFLKQGDTIDVILVNRA